MMNRLLRLLVTGIVTMLALVSVAAPARAADDLPSASKAGRWLVGQLIGGNHLDDGFSTVGPTIDALFALAATKDAAFKPTTDEMLDYVQAHVADYVSPKSGESPEAAAKLLILADAYGVLPTSFGGVDLVAKVTDAVAADGTFGAYPGPFASALGMIALSRAEKPVPASMVTKLEAGKGTDGGWGYAAGQPSDADSTGMAVMGLAAAGADTASGLAWLTSSQKPNGSWDGYVPVNSTSIAAMAQLATGTAATKAQAYLAGAQLPNGAFPNAGQADVVATNQGILALAGGSYLDVAWAPTWTYTPPTATPTPRPTTAKPSPNPRPTSSSRPTSPRPSTVRPTTDATRAPATRPPLPQTGSELDPAALLGAVGAMLLGAGLFAARRTRR